MKRYKVLKPYWDRKVGSILENVAPGGLNGRDYVALELGALEEIKEPPKPKELWEKFWEAQDLMPASAMYLDQIATEHFKEKMPKRKSANNPYEEGVQDGIALVNRALFGEEK